MCGCGVSSFCKFNQTIQNWQTGVNFVFDKINIYLLKCRFF